MDRSLFAAGKILRLPSSLGKDQRDYYPPVHPRRTSLALLSLYPRFVLTDEEADTIRKRLAEGCRGPVLLKWPEQLLQDRDERRQRERERDSGPPQP